MKNENVWVIRWVFDPVHKGHISAMISAIETLTLSKLYVIVKFIWEKDPIASLEDRLEMIRINLAQYNLPVDVQRQNVKWHIDELLNLRKKHWWNVVNICWSDKAIREMDVYWNTWDTFWMVCRPEFQKFSETHSFSLNKWINLVEINPLISTSSTKIREWFSLGKFYQDWLEWNVSWYIKQNGLYLPYNQGVNQEEFTLGWFLFLDNLIPIFPDLRLLEIKTPEFNSIQSQKAWKEKYIRTIVKARKLRWDLLVEFVLEAEKIFI